MSAFTSFAVGMFAAKVERYWLMNSTLFDVLVTYQSNSKVNEFKPQNFQYTNSFWSTDSGLRLIDFCPLKIQEGKPLHLTNYEQ